MSAAGLFLDTVSDMVGSLETLGFGSDTDINASDAVDVINLYFDNLRTELAEAIEEEETTETAYQAMELERDQLRGTLENVRAYLETQARVVALKAKGRARKDTGGFVVRAA